MKAKRVLIVEDDRTTQELARLVLQDAGYDVDVVDSAEAAELQLQGVLPDVVLMDRELPGKNGLALTRELKANTRTSGAIVLAFTSCNSPADDALAIQAGADGFVHKPFDVAGLIRTVGWHVSTRDARTQPVAPSTPLPPTRPTMKITRSLSAAAALVMSAAAAASAQTTATQTVTFSVAAINQVAISGAAPTLAIVAATTGGAVTGVNSSAITYAVTTNQTGAKITGQIATAMPANVTLSATLAAPAGATSAGQKTLTATAVDLVTAITKVSASGLSLQYDLDATVAAGVVASASRLVTLTITGGT